MSVQNVEHTTRFTTTVDTLEEAWAFATEYLPLVGMDPTIHISPIWQFIEGRTYAQPSSTKRQFEVLVEGMVEVKREGLHAVD